MKKNKRQSNKALVLLIALVALISIGYAAIATNLQINGGATIGKPSWDIHFENVNIAEGSVATTEAGKAQIVKNEETNEDTIVTYSVNLEKPGDFYEFTVDVVNKGTITGKLSSLGEVTGLTEAQKDFVKYSVEYTDKDDNAVVANSLLKKDETNKVKVRVEFDKDIDNETLESIKDLTDEDLKLNLQYELNYEQE